MGIILKLLAIETGLGEPTVASISSTAPLRYKTYTIPKRDGSRRVISQPAQELKLIQRALVEILLKNLPIHPCATAYREGRSIFDNAHPHVGNGPIVKMDFKDFFPSIKRNDWINYCEVTKCVEDEDDLEITSQILFQKQPKYGTPRLAIGAPSSPMISNILMYDFDHYISEALVSDRVVYTRYADDLTFSAPRTGFMHNITKIVHSATKKIKHPKLTINPDKTHYITPKFRRAVTGLVLSNDGRVTIGRDRKRQIHAAVHNYKTKGKCEVDLRVLSGLLAYINAVEPEFIDSLRNKYGSDVISVIQKSVGKDKIL